MGLFFLLLQPGSGRTWVLRLKEEKEEWVGVLREVIFRVYLLSNKKIKNFLTNRKRFLPLQSQEEGGL